jgi:hypothetical protein
MTTLKGIQYYLLPRDEAISDYRLFSWGWFWNGNHQTFLCASASSAILLRTVLAGASPTISINMRKGAGLNNGGLKLKSRLRN